MSLLLLLLLLTVCLELVVPEGQCGLAGGHLVLGEIADGRDEDRDLFGGEGGSECASGARDGNDGIGSA